jgi:hypothetical protein
MMAQVKDLYAGTSGDATAVAGGGTGATTASGARANLGVAIGTDVQAYDAELSTLAGMSSSRATYLASTEGFGFRNRIINGDMRIDQRNAGASVTPTDQQYSTDRWKSGVSAASKFSLQQTSVAPSGFVNSLKATSLTAYTVGASEFFNISQVIEGFNSSDMMWGTASAATITISFQVNSSLTGTFGGVVRNYDGARAYPFTYTVSAANTWEQKTITIAGDTSGTWNTTNSGSLQLIFNLGAGATVSGPAGAWSSTGYRSATGATSVVGTSGATFYITGVQLEAGSVASPFERRDYGRELMMCQRYYYNSGSGSALQFGAQGSTTGVEYMYMHPVFMRASPTLSYTSIGNFTAYVFNAAASKTLVAASINYATTKKALVQASWIGSSGTAGATCSSDAVNGDFFAFSAEL